ncbi:NAD(P)H-hydrate dehydratase [bacterium]|nr:MAG: NAD(P)H-hydrate dehydratase [bacterium]
MFPLLDAARMGRLDRYTIGEIGLPGAVLMETAGRAVAREAVTRFKAMPGDGHVSILCGGGNNGGDGFVAARGLSNRGYPVRVYLAGEKAKVKGDAALHMNAFLKSGGNVAEALSPPPDPFGGSSFIIDALLGTGVEGEVREETAGWIRRVNSSSLPVVSVDIPSGVSSDTGRVMGEAVKAALTVTFGYYKKGHFLGEGAALAGEVVLADIGIPPGSAARENPDLFLLAKSDFRGLFARTPSSHKGDYGHLLILAGSTGKMGAAALASLAALRSGAGLVTAAYPSGAAEEARFPMEAMTAPVGKGGEWSAGAVEGLIGLVGNSDAIVLGPGMGTGPGPADFLEKLFSLGNLPPCVIDADALNILASNPALWKKRPEEAVLTPHPGEAGRLLGLTTARIQEDRSGALLGLVEKFSSAVILKGASTLVGSPGEIPRIVSKGNPGMATAGSGDVLSGIAGAFLARGLGVLKAAEAGAFIHGSAGDAASGLWGVESLIASDITEALPQIFMELEKE